MRHYRILFVVAVGLLFTGFAMLDRGLDPQSTTQGEEAISIPGGPQWFYVVQLDLDQGGQVMVDYQVESEGALNLYLFEPENYGEYFAQGFASAVVKSASGRSGSFTAQVPAEGTYFLVFAHGRGYEFMPQEIEISYQFTGLQSEGPLWGLVLLGLAALGTGTVTATLAAVGRLRFLATVSADPQPA